MAQGAGTLVHVVNSGTCQGTAASHGRGVGDGVATGVAAAGGRMTPPPPPPAGGVSTTVPPGISGLDNPIPGTINDDGGGAIPVEGAAPPPTAGGVNIIVPVPPGGLPNGGGTNTPVPGNPLFAGGLLGARQIELNAPMINTREKFLDNTTHPFSL
jgi:hypothetical protein